jgi:hypothetical protein
MQTFYVTFGDLLIDYYLIVTAKDEAIVRAFMKKKSGINCWCRVLTEKPSSNTKPLIEKATELYYASAEHM